jgi:hypothetical protein
MTESLPTGWLHISAEGLAAGVTASAITYTLVSLTSSAAAVGTGLLVDSLGSAAATATRYFWGDIPAMTLRVLCRVGSSNSEDALRRGGDLTATAAAVLVGGTTAITVTVGSRLIHATVKYGGTLTQEVAALTAKAFLTGQGAFEKQKEEPYESVWKDADDESWAILEAKIEQDTLSHA